MDEINKQFNRWIAVAAAFFTLAFSAEVASQRYLFADGVNFLLQILRDGTFSHWDYPRQFAHYVTQWPAVFALTLHVHSIALISALYGVGMFAFPLWTLAACLWFTPRESRRYLLYLIFALAYLALNSTLFIISESHVAVGCFFVLFFFAFFAEYQAHSSARMLLAGVTAVAALRLYESYFVLGLVLTALALVRRRQSQAATLRLVLLWMAVCGVASSVMGTYWMLFSDRNVQKVGLRTIACALALDPNMLMSSAVLLSFVWAMHLPGHSRAHPARTVGAGILGLGFGLMPLYSMVFVPTTLHYPARVLNIAIPLFVAALMLWRHRKMPHSGVSLWAPAPLCLMLVWNTTWQIVVSAQWRNYTHAVHSAVDLSPTPLLRLQDTPLQNNVFNWGWTLPALSIVVQGMHNGEVHALLIDNARPEFQPFDPTDRAQWPDLHEFGIRYPKP